MKRMAKRGKRRRWKQILSERAIELRLRPTKSEMIFSERLKEYVKSKDYSFISQQVINLWIFDFYIPEIGILIEIDGPQHENENRKKKDNAKEKDAIARGFLVIRVLNKDVSIFNFNSIIEDIKRGNTTRKVAERFTYTCNQSTTGLKP